MAFTLRAPTTRAIGRLLTLVVIALLAALFQHLGPRRDLTGNTMLLGFLLLAAFVAGEVAREVRCCTARKRVSASGCSSVPTFSGCCPRAL